MDPERNDANAHRWRVILAWAVFAGMAAFLLISEHRVHALGYLPYLLILACPLMHIFMHGGHGGHGGHGRTPADADEPPRTDRLGADRI